MHFLPPQKIKFHDTTNLIVTTKKLNFNALPDEVYDSTLAQPFSKAPIVKHFNWDSLPHAASNYKNLPSKLLHFKSYFIHPETIKAGPLAFKNLTNQPFFDIPNAGNIIGLVWQTLEDKAGFIWIASTNGIFRYDGQNLVRYLQMSFRIYDLKEDAEGQIWITFQNLNTSNFGIYLLNAQRNILKQLSFKDLECNIVHSLIPDNNGKIWIATDRGVRIINVNKNSIKSFTVKQGLSDTSAYFLLEDDKKNIWITTREGLDIINTKQGTITYLKKGNGLLSDSIWQITEDEQKRIWVTIHRTGVSVINRKAGAITSLDLATMNSKPTDQSSGINRMMSDGNGDMLIDFINGGRINSHDLKIINLEKKTSKQINLPNEFGFTSSFLLDSHRQIWVSNFSGGSYILNKNGYHIHHAGNTNITSLAEDNRNNIWIASINNGIKILNPVTGIAKILNKASGLSNNTLNDVEFINGRIYIATSSGTDIIDSAYTTITSIGNNTNTTEDPVFHQGNMWQLNFGTRGIEVFNLKKKLQFHVDVSGNKKGVRVENLMQDKDGNISLLTTSAEYGVIDSGSSFIRYADSPLTKLFRLNEELICFDVSGNTWIGIGALLYKINKRRDSITMLTPQNGLINSDIISLNEYHNRIYSGTHAGVNIITPPGASTGNSWHIQSLGKNDGFSNNFGQIQSETITHDGTYLWVGNGGITFFPPRQLNKNKAVPPKTFITGIDLFNQPQHFSNKPGGYKVTQDTLWDANSDKYYLKGQKLNTVSDVNQHKIKWDSVATAYNLPVNLTLAYDENNINFHFVQADAGAQDAVPYSYFLKGYDTAWSDITTNTSSKNYFELPDGKYTFKVSSLYNYQWSTPVEFSFTISKPWWKTWWAFVIYFVLIGLIYAAFRSINLNRQNKLLEVKVNQRTEQLSRSLSELKSTQKQLIQSEKMASLGELTAGIAHEIQNPLNFVNNFSEVNKELLDELKAERLKQKAERDEQTEDEIINDVIVNSEKINHHGKRADAIVKGMLQHSRVSSGVKEPTDINDLCDEYLRLSYHGLRAKDKSFNATMNTNFDQSIGKINIVAQDIGRVILNLINNAFYAVNERLRQAQPDILYEPTVSLTTKKSETHVIITVSDNGNGIPQKIVDKIFQPFFTTKPTGQGTGLGLSLSYDIIKAAGGEIKVKSKEGEGSEFMIILPDKIN